MRGDAGEARTWSWWRIAELPRLDRLRVRRQGYRVRRLTEGIASEQCYGDGAVCLPEARDSHGSMVA